MYHKKILLLVVILTCCVALSACSGTNESEATATIVAPTATSAPTQTPEPTATPEPTPVPTPIPVASGTNVALNCFYEISSTTGDMHVQWGWSSDYINDGRIETTADHAGWVNSVGKYMDGPECDEYVLFDFEGIYEINKVLLYPVGPGEGFPLKYEVQISVDGTNFTTVANIENDTHNADRISDPAVIEFDASPARYVQVLITEMAHSDSGVDGYLCKLAEIEVLAA